MYAQKGTGGARHQDRGAPLFLGGGHSFPVRPRDYSYKLNRRIRHLAIRMALTTKYLQGKLIIVDDLKVEVPKTREAQKVLDNFGVSASNDAMIIDGNDVDADFERASWNLFYVHYTKVAGLNVYDMLKRDNLVITKESLDAIKKRWSRYNPKRNLE